MSSPKINTHTEALKPALGWWLRLWLAERCSCITEQVSEQTPLVYIRDICSMCSSFPRSGSVPVLIPAPPSALNVLATIMHYSKIHCMESSLTAWWDTSWQTWLQNVYLKKKQNKYVISVNRETRRGIINSNAIHQIRFSQWWEEGGFAASTYTRSIHQCAFSSREAGYNQSLIGAVRGGRQTALLASFTSCRHVGVSVILDHS